MRKSERQDLCDDISGLLLHLYKEAIDKKDWKSAKTLINLYNKTAYSL